MRKSGAALITALLVTAAAGTVFVNLATANPYAPLHLPKITITNSGSISPETSYINKTGNIYTLTADIIQEYSIEIQCSNIVFDGAGHLVDVAVEGAFSDNGYLAIYMDVGINLVDVHNVILKNVKVLANNINTINLQYSSNCQITAVTTGKSIRILGDSNTIIESNTGIAVYAGSSNLITRNNITDVFVGSDCYSNKFFQNNFILTDYPEFFTESLWDNGSIGNYWSNYTIKYSNASEIGNTGIGDTPYHIERGFYTTRDYPNQKNIDRYPLMYPWGAPAVSVYSSENTTYSGSFLLNFSLSKPAAWIGYSLDGQNNATITENATIGGLPSGLHNITVYAKDSFGNTGTSETVTFSISEPFPIVPVAAVSAVSIAAVIAAGLLLYNRKRRKEAQQK